MARIRETKTGSGFYAGEMYRVRELGASEAVPDGATTVDEATPLTRGWRPTSEEQTTPTTPTTPTPPTGG